MWNKGVNLIILFLISSIVHFNNAKPTEFEKCCRYGFEDGVKLNMLRDNKKWSVIRTQTFGYCESQVLFGVTAYRKCKIIGEEMAINCNIGKYYALLGYDCNLPQEELNPASYACCMTCSNGLKFAEEEFQLFENKTNEIGEELFKNENLYLALKSQVDKDLDKFCQMLNLVTIIPELQLSTFNQCCRSWNYNYNQNFYPDHFNLNDTCNRINICLDKQSHTQFNFNKITNRNDLIKLKTENVMKIVKEHMKWENESFDKNFDEIKISKPEGKGLRSLDSSMDDTNIKISFDEFHNKKSRSLEDEKEFHLNQISSYELNLRKVPLEKFKYHYCNRVCKDTKQLNYKEFGNMSDSTGKYKGLTQCFYNYSEKFCAQSIECSSGFFANHNNTKCVELDECKEELDDCLPQSEYCVNHFDGYTCECKPGYKYDLESKKCMNIDECKEDTRICPPNSYCKDLEGSYECNCFEGLFKDEFGQCLSFLTKKPAKDNKKAPTTYFTQLPVENKDDNEDEEKRLSEKIKVERENLEKLKNGFLLYDKIISSEYSDKKIEKIDDRLTARKVLSNGQSMDNKMINQTLFEDKSTKSEINELSNKDNNLKEELKIGPEISQKIDSALISLKETNLTNRKEPIQNLRSSDLRFSEQIDFNPCPNGYLLSPYLPRKCVDIDECSNSTLNNCNKNQTCINLSGKYECKLKDECPKGYKEINLNLYTSESNLEQQSTRTSTICKYVHEKSFSSNEERMNFEKEKSIIQFIVFDTATLPFNNFSDYEMVTKDKKLAIADAGRLKPNAIIFYLVDKKDATNEKEFNFKANLKVKATTCKQIDLPKKFKVNELNSNVFAVVMLDSIKESCSIDFNLEIESDANHSNYYNRESYNIHLILYDYKPDFTIVGVLAD